MSVFLLFLRKKIGGEVLVAVQNAQDDDDLGRYMEKQNAGSIGEAADICSEIASVPATEATRCQKSRLRLQIKDQPVGSVFIFL